MGAQGGVIMEGRDIGTVVFPDAEVKIFLDADSSVREGRRVSQANAQDDPARAEGLKQELRERDRRDTTRAAAPLKAAEDAVHIDSSALRIEEVIARAEEIVEEKLRQRGVTAPLKPKGLNGPPILSEVTMAPDGRKLPSGAFLRAGKYFLRGGLRAVRNLRGAMQSATVL